MPHTGWSEPEFEAREGDEIPGTSTFIYRLNRFRRPEEYSHFERIREESDKAKLELGIPYNISLEEIIVLLSRERDLAHSRLNQLNLKTSEIASMKLELEQVKKSAILDQSAHKQAVKTLEAFRCHQHQLIVNLRKYGGHTTNCDYTDLQGCGRVIDAASVCTCDWIKVHNALDNHAKKIDSELKACS